MAAAKSTRTGNKGVNTVRPIVEKQTKNGTKKQVRTSTNVAANTGMKGRMRQRMKTVRSS